MLLNSDAFEKLKAICIWKYLLFAKSLVNLDIDAIDKGVYHYPNSLVFMLATWLCQFTEHIAVVKSSLDGSL